MKHTTRATSHALASFDDAVIARTALNYFMEFDNGDLSEAQRNSANARHEVFDHVQTIFTLIGSNIDDFKAFYIEFTPSSDTNAVLFRSFEVALASADSSCILVADYVQNDDDSSIDRDATTVDPSDNPADLDMDDDAEYTPAAHHSIETPVQNTSDVES